jgi:hypothetical protein
VRLASLVEGDDFAVEDQAARRERPDRSSDLGIHPRHVPQPAIQDNHVRAVFPGKCADTIQLELIEEARAGTSGALRPG